MVNGLFADDEFAALLQEAARGMKAGGMDPEGIDLPRLPRLPQVTVPDHD